jgi:hypothetical protein
MHYIAVYSIDQWGSANWCVSKEETEKNANGKGWNDFKDENATIPPIHFPSQCREVWLQVQSTRHLSCCTQKESVLGTSTRKIWIQHPSQQN